MKRNVTLAAVFVLLVALVPALGLLRGAGASQTEQTAGDDGLFEQPEPQDEPVFEGGEILVLDEATGEVLTLTERAYVLGAVMSEMPAFYEPEALKAQAVAAHTYALHVKALREKQPLDYLNGAYFAIDSSKKAGYLSDEQARVLYGAQYEEYHDKMAAAVDAVLGYTLTYGGEPISACYHAISPGRTEASENVFGAPLPYLAAVDSSWDVSADGYESSATFTRQELQERLARNGSEFKPSGEPETWLGSANATESGTVRSLSICGTEFSGVALRGLLGLRSAAFTAAYENGAFVFTVHGYGHGVGMSQYGANCMALEGNTFDRILAHYYPGAELTKTA